MNKCSGKELFDVEVTAHFMNRTDDHVLLTKRPCFCRFPQEKMVHDALLLATGSADNYAYVYDVSGPSVRHFTSQDFGLHSEIMSKLSYE
jgi:hypothetical protein